MENIKITKSGTEPLKQNLWLQNDKLMSFTSNGCKDIAGAFTLNGGVGAIALPISALAFRQAPLKSTPQDGLLEYNSTDLCFTKGTTRYKVSLTAI